MSNFWSVYIIVLTGLSIIATIALLWKTSHIPKDELDASDSGHVWDGDIRELNNPLPRWWLILFYLTIAFALVYLVLYPGLGQYAGVLGWSSAARYEDQMSRAEARYQPVFAAFAARPVEQLARDGQALSAGYNLFVNECAQCHGSDARGAKSFPNLSDNAWLWGGEPEQIKASIRHGRTGVMPPWGAVLGEDGVNAVTEYVLKLANLDHRPDLAAAGAVQFQSFCASCHAANGVGNQALGAPNLTDTDWLYGSDHVSIADIIRAGRQNQMPAFQQRLGDERIHVLAAYVYSLSQ